MAAVIGNLVPDLIVNDAVIVDPKVVACITETHIAQMIGYLNITGLDLALLINFKNARLEWKRMLRLLRTEFVSYSCLLSVKSVNPWLSSSEYGESNRLA